MNIAVVGAGVAGSYLSRLLQNCGHQVEVFESSKREYHWPTCAWGACKFMLRRFSDRAGLNFDDYILHTGKTLKMKLPNGTIEYLQLKGLVTYNKQKWEHDLLTGTKISYGIKYTLGTFPIAKFDYILDCTGFHRSLLPRSEQDFIIPSYEYLVENV